MSLVIDSTVKTVKVKVSVDVDELRHWAGKHADAGHAGVAHVLYKAAEGVESLTEQALREAREERVPEPLPVVAHKADGETDAERFAAWLAQVRRDAIEPARLIHDRDHTRAVKLGAVCPSCETWEALETALEES